MDDPCTRAPLGQPATPVQTSPHLRTIADLLAVPVEAFGTPAAPHILHESENGDRWLLRRGADGAPVVRHIGNPASGGHVTDLSVAAFLTRDQGSPQHRALAARVDAVLTAQLGS